MFQLRNLRLLNLPLKPHRTLVWQSYGSRFSSTSTSVTSSSLSSSSASSKSSQHTAVSAERQSVAALSSNIYGQPVAGTHPHLIDESCLVPGVCLEEFQMRRRKFMNGMQEFAADNLENEDRLNRRHLVVIPSSTKKYMTGKIPYIFRQNSDFYYLSGCLEPDTVLMMTIDEGSNVKSTLFMRPKDKHAELWEGTRTGVDLALDLFGVDETYAIENFQLELARRVNSEKPVIWYDTQSSDLTNVTEIIGQVIGPSKKSVPLHSPTIVVQSMRLFKSHAEQELMRRTCQIASAAINEVMRETRPGISEHHIYAMVDYKCRMRNASHLAYPPVVASGSNATTIHYINNTQLTKSGDLVLMDAGCEYGGYSSDITRTWPVSGEFTAAQRVLYDIVLQLQNELIDTLLKEGGDTLDNLFNTMCFKLGKYLQEAGLVSKTITNRSDYTKAGFRFCPHHVSHYLGMDVHDTPHIPRLLELLPGMVFTVEPGIYIPHDCTDVPEEFRGIGIRLEDDVLITTDNKVEVLTASCCKEHSELEDLFKRKPSNVERKH